MLQTTEPLIFVSERHGQSKSGNPYQFIKLANPKNFENYELFGEGVSVSGLSSGDQVYCDFCLSSGFGNTNLSVLSLNLAK